MYHFIMWLPLCNKLHKYHEQSLLKERTINSESVQHIALNYATSLKQCQGLFRSSSCVEHFNSICSFISHNQVFLPQGFSLLNEKPSKTQRLFTVFQDKATNNSQLIATIKLCGERENKEFSNRNTWSQRHVSSQHLKVCYTGT